MAAGVGNVQLRVALIVKNADPSELFQIFVVRQDRPKSHSGGQEEVDDGDSELWELPSSPLGRLSGRADADERLSKAVSNVKFNFECLGLNGFDVHAAVAQVTSSPSHIITLYQEALLSVCLFDCLSTSDNLMVGWFWEVYCMAMERERERACRNRSFHMRSMMVPFKHCKPGKEFNFE
jgi:hypothetical protein